MNCRSIRNAIGKSECSSKLNHVNQMGKIKVYQELSCYDEFDNYLGKLVGNEIINSKRVIAVINNE